MTSYDDDFPTCKQTFATLRLISDNVEPSQITALLGIDPSDAFMKGESFGNGLVRKFNGWFLSSESWLDSKDTRRHIDWVLSKIAGKSVELAQLSSRGVQVDISCLWLSTGQGGPVLSPPQMQELARLGIEIWWDVYFSDTNREVAPLV